MKNSGKTRTVGLTGGIGSGKSTVAKMFSDLGVPVISADRLAKEMVVPGSPLLEAIVIAFGDEILGLDGRLDRARLAEIVFTHAEQRKILESILHPPIRERMWKEVAALENCYCILEIPLLIETGQWQQVDRVLVVACNQQLQINRLRSTRNFSLRKARQVMSAQMNDAERMQHASDRLRNESTLKDLAKQVKQLNSLYSSLFCC